MLLEIGSCLAMGGVAGFAFFKQNGPTSNDAEKIQKIFANVGWGGRGGETIRLHRKTKFKGGAEYVYQLPLGFDRKKVENNKHVLEDGLNIRHKFYEFDKSELLRLKWDATILQQIKKILTTQKIRRKEIELEFDGMLKIKVFNEGMPDRIDWNEGMLKRGTFQVVIGVTRNGLIYHDFDKRKHLIVAGSTGGGKSVTVKGMIAQLIFQNPDNVELTLIDLKGGPAFARFKDCRQVLHFETDNKGASKAIKAIEQQMDKDYEKIVNGGFEDVSEARISKRHFIFIDEAADLMDEKEAMESLIKIVRKGRGAGYYLVYTTQYPSAAAIPIAVKRNIPARLSFILDDSVASNTVLDASGAEDLPEIPGRGIYKHGKLTTIQAPYMSNKKIKELIEPNIVIRAKKEDQHEQTDGKTAKGEKHSIEFKKV